MSDTAALHARGNLDADMRRAEAERLERFVRARLGVVRRPARDILEEPGLREKLLAQGLSVAIEPPQQFGDRIRKETALWAAVIKSRHITIQ